MVVLIIASGMHTNNFAIGSLCIESHLLLDLEFLSLWAKPFNVGRHSVPKSDWQTFTNVGGSGECVLGF